MRPGKNNYTISKYWNPYILFPGRVYLLINRHYRPEELFVPSHLYMIVRQAASITPSYYVSRAGP